MKITKRIKPKTHTTAPLVQGQREFLRGGPVESLTPNLGDFAGYTLIRRSMGNDDPLSTHIPSPLLVLLMFASICESTDSLPVPNPEGTPTP
jgi:hypothetical protein